MKKTLRETRETFKNFFKKNDHEPISSSPLIPQNDPTLMFTNSGMVQFKNIFTGIEKRNYKRATTSQKCVRAANSIMQMHTIWHILSGIGFYFYDGKYLYANVRNVSTNSKVNTNEKKIIQSL